MDQIQSQAAYWRNLLAGCPLRIELPIGRTPAPGAAPAHAETGTRLDAALIALVHSCATRLDTSASQLAMVAWAVLLGRLSSQGDIVLATQDAFGDGSIDSSRVLPLRIELPASASPGELLPQLRMQANASRPHAGLTTGQWRDVLPNRGTAADLQHAGPFQLGFAAASRFEPALQQCELALLWNQASDGVEVVLRYQSHRFGESAMQACLGYWRNLLSAIVQDPDEPFERLRWMSDAESREAIRRWNDTAVAYPRIESVHELFEAQARRTPDALALVQDDTHRRPARRLTYAQLDSESSRLARHLRALGVGPDARVAIYVDRGVEMIVGLLAVLKAGGAYVPLDPTYPAERLVYTLQDSEPVLLLTQSGMENDWRAVLGEAADGLPVVDLGAETLWQNQSSWPLASVEGEGTSALRPSRLTSLPQADIELSRSASRDASPAERLAYVLYTSGSTGQPKGVAMPHGPLVNLIQWQLRQPGLERPLRTLQFAALGFDVAFQETFATLCNGGELHLIDQDTRLSADRLFAFIVEHRIERLFLPYFALQILAEGMHNVLAGQAEGAQLSCGLREIITAGEQLRIEPKIVQFFQRLPGCRLHNHYGPTETHVVTALTLDEDPAQWPRLPSIGHPIANARVYLLDSQGRPVPDGVIGELFLAGPVTARGYLKRDDLTAERFVQDPFDATPDARMYRTGDLGRRLADGAIEYLGRSDFQVKIRGFRIELGEIEAQLMAYPGVRQAGVMAREGSLGVKRLVAYVAPLDASMPVALDALRRHLIERLPDYMIPAAYVQLDALPLSPNGKLDRGALPPPGRERPQWAGPYQPPRGKVEAALCRILAEVLDLERIGRDDHFFELGGSSLLAVRVLEQVRRENLGELSTMALFRDPTPAALARVLEQGAQHSIDPSRLSAQVRNVHDDDPIAIVAMAGRFPGAPDVEALWRHLCDGVDGVSRFAADELDASVPAALRADPLYVPARGVIEDYDRFDAAFFGISPREAELMDPQQRILLELCWECIERAGHVPDATRAPVGVFAGMYNASYYQNNVLAHPDLIEKLGAFQVMLDNEKDYIATRVAHKLNLTGPAISVHTACSTSLVAIVQAVDSLRAGRCHMALAGGIAITCPVRSGHVYQEGAMLSADGHTRSFDAQASGTVFSDGAAVVLLKRLSDALADGDPVVAVIRGAAVNNDGGGKASFTAPSSAGQAAVIAMAHADAGVEPRSIGYVEAHGTATPLGDPIEIEGLTRAFRLGTDEVGFCEVGSIKSNLGHTLMAAGAAGVIKTALALREKCLPATAHFGTPNPTIDFANTPFTVSGRTRAWEHTGDMPRRAGVSSFGVGGTNAHVVLEEAPPRGEPEAVTGPQLLTLSARTPAALAQACTRLGEHLQAHPDENLADVAWTLAVGRKAFAHRFSVVAEDAADAATRLLGKDTSANVERSKAANASEVVFLFPGQGCQYPGMGRALHAAEPVFREAFDQCAGLLTPELGLDLRTLVFGDDAEALLPTAIMQPSIFAFEYALARWWMSLGVKPAAMIGHSVGEFVAATLAGVFELPDALRLVACRGRLMQAQPAGAMLSVRLPMDALLQRLPPSLSLAAENAPGACVVAGTHADVDAFKSALEADGVACRPLRTSHAFHSAMMEPVVAQFADEVAAVVRSAPALPIVSTATGDWLDADAATTVDYWARHLRAPVRFSSAVSRVLDDSSRLLLEVGPRSTLTTLSRQHPALKQHGIAAVSSLADAVEGEHPALLDAVGQLWSRGAGVAPAALDRRSAHRRVRLPTYPFERQRHWVEPAVAAGNEQTTPVSLNAIAAPAAPEISMQAPVLSVAQPPHDRKPQLVAQLKEVFEDVAGFDLADADHQANFIELGLDSLMLTQVALQLQKTFEVRITFRQLMGECASLEKLSEALDAQLPQVQATTAPQPTAPQPTAPQPAMLPAVSAPVALAPLVGVQVHPTLTMANATAGSADLVRAVIDQQMQLMSQQLALLGGTALHTAPSAPAAMTPAPAASAVVADAAVQRPAATAANEDEAAIAHTRYDVKKAFGAIARIDSAGGTELGPKQRQHLDAFMQRYLARTPKSKAFTQDNRAHMADPRVVTGFRPLTKEIVYQIVIERSKGSRLWDIDGNEYVDALNGFGTSLFGWQPDFVMEAVRRQLDLGYEIGPQHPLAGDVARLVCELTGHDRAALCNTGSEAVLGAMRIARTVTGRETIVVFSGSYHGINDEVIVRGTKKLRAVPAAPGILRNTADKVLVLDYGTPESLAIIRERAHELAAVLVEPVQSRRPDFQPVEFLKEVRAITADTGAVLIFDEVITGFRSHPGGTQALFGIKADLATYGKVVGGGYPIGVMAGKREFMDALDGGHWQYGDDSVPTVGVTYFAGTFVRHPLTLSAAKASLEHMKQHGAALQQRLNERTTAMAAEINAFSAEVGAPVRIKHFASMWRTHFEEDHPLQDLLFAMMRSRGIHILDNFPCFFTTAHSEADFQAIIKAYKDAVTELQDGGMLPRAVAAQRPLMDASRPVVEGARLGRDPDGKPAWYVPSTEHAGKFVKVDA